MDVCFYAICSFIDLGGKYLNRKQIKYVGFYDLLESKSDRVYNLAATNKMNYIARALVEVGYNVEFISPSWMGDKSDVSFEKKKTVKMGDHKKVTFCPSWKTSNKITRNIKILFTLVWLFFYLLLNTKKDEIIIAYHVQWISLPIRAAKFFKRFKLILEVEEIYQDVMKFSDRFVVWENKLIDNADAFLYSTDLLKKKLANNKPDVVIYGEYHNYNKLTDPINDGKIHLLYAGIIDDHKRGAFNSLEATKYLSEKYVLHIIGFGQVGKLQEMVNEYNKTNECKIIFDGLKSGNEYIEYCQSCHIGLSTQSMSGEYLESSFPSKLLSYLAMGLRVVSCEIKCVTESKIRDVISYYSHDNPSDIAEAIRKVNINTDYESSKIIQGLHEEFVEDVKNLINKI